MLPRIDEALHALHHNRCLKERVKLGPIDSTRVRLIVAVAICLRLRKVHILAAIDGEIQAIALHWCDDVHINSASHCIAWIV